MIQTHNNYCAWITALVCILACPSGAAEFDKIQREVAALPQARVEVSISRETLMVDGHEITHQALVANLRNLPKPNVYCVEGKFSQASREQIEELALAAIRPGGRFFYRQARGSIDSLFHCFEFIEKSPDSSGGQPSEMPNKSRLDNPLPRPESEIEP